MSADKLDDWLTDPLGNWITGLLDYGKTSPPTHRFADELIHIYRLIK
jgi:hypothetical protein